MEVFDATTLLCLLDPEAKASTDTKTGQPVTHVRERIEFLVTELDKRKEKIIVPTPVLSELLVRADTAGPDYLDILNKSAVFKIVDFDQRAAVEVAAATRKDMDAGNKRGGADSPSGPRLNLTARSSPLLESRALPPSILMTAI